jgi:hypothetical protein
MFMASRGGAWRIWLFIGLGLCLYGYYEWSHLQVPSEAALELAVEAQYQSELAQMQQRAGEMPIEMTPEWESKFRTAIRNEYMAPIHKTEKRIHATLGMGLLLVVMSLSLFVLSYMTERQKKNPGN